MRLRDYASIASLSWMIPKVRRQAEMKMIRVIGFSFVKFVYPYAEGVPIFSISLKLTDIQQVINI